MLYKQCSSLTVRNKLLELARRQHNDIHQHEMNAIILYIFPSKLAYNKAKAQREQCVGSNKRSVHRSVRYACIPAQTFSDHIITATCVLSLQRSLQGLQRYSIDSKTTSIISTLQFLPVGRFILVLEGPFCAQYICRAAIDFVLRAPRIRIQNITSTILPLYSSLSMAYRTVGVISTFA